jgi:PAS domain S-box-containing protein
MDPTNSMTPAPLRNVAETRLREGVPPPLHPGWTTGRDALSVLHDLAGSPHRAGDALKLLHELQVHQVELAMQQEQLEQNRTEAAESLQRYIERFDFAPVGYFSVEPDGRIVEANLTGACLLGVNRAELPGRPLESLLAADGRAALRAVLTGLRNGDFDGTCEVSIETAAGPRRMQVVGNAAPRTRFFNVTLTPIPDRSA